MKVLDGWFSLHALLAHLEVADLDKLILTLTDHQYMHCTAAIKEPYPQYETT